MMMRPNKHFNKKTLRKGRQRKKRWRRYNIIDKDRQKERKKEREKEKRKKERKTERKKERKE